MNLERVKERIAKLLEVARDDAATEGEIENAIRAARNLMLAYHVEEADLGAGNESSEPAMGCSASTTKFSNIAAWEHSLAFFVADLIGGVCSYYQSRHRRVFKDGRLKSFGSVTFYGIHEEAELAAETYEELATTIFTMARAKYGGAYRGDGGVYAEGFVQGLFEQLRNAASDGGDSATTELVVRCRAIVESKKNRARRWLREECGIRLGRGSATSGASGSVGAHFEGRSDGRSCDITEVGGRRAKLSGSPKLLTAGGAARAEQGGNKG